MPELRMVPPHSMEMRMMRLCLQQKKTNELLKGIAGRLSIMEMRMMRTKGTYGEDECARQVSNTIKEADAPTDDQFLFRQIVGEAHAMLLSRQYSPGPNLSKDQWTCILEMGIRLASDDVRIFEQASAKNEQWTQGEKGQCSRNQWSRAKDNLRQLEEYRQVHKEDCIFRPL